MVEDLALELLHVDLLLGDCLLLKQLLPLFEHGLADLQVFLYRL